MKVIPYQATNDTVMCVVDGKSHEVDSSQPNYADLRAALLEGRWGDVRKHLTVGQVIAEWAFGEFTVVAGAVRYQDEDLPSALNQLILKMVAAGEDPQPIMHFWERLDENPSYRSRNQTYDFLMRNPGIPFTDDGYVLFYKGVRQDFRDCHSGKFDNSPGQKLYMKRNRVSDDPTKACHFGFHVGARSYAASFGRGQTVICKVDPADIVCVPNDCSQQKVRVHRYEVVGVDGGELLSSTTHTPEVTVPTPAPVEPPVDPNEPLVAPVGTHTDGTPLEAGETAPLPDDQEAAVVLPLTGTDWDHLNGMDSVALMGESLRGTLAKYARFNCLIIAASKMRGGKAVLVPAIVKARGYADPCEDDAPEHIRAEWCEDADDECDECGEHETACICDDDDTDPGYDE